MSTAPTDDASKAEVVWVDPATLPTRPPFEGLFPIKPDDLARITADMKVNHFDKSQPIHVWRQGNCVVDGHTRKLAAIAANEQAAVHYHDFADEDAAFDYAIRNQRNRRNMGDDEILSLVAAADRRRKRGGDRKSVAAKSKRENSPFDQSMSSQTDPGKSSREETAEKLGVSPDKVRAARVVLKDPEAAAEVRAGKKKLFRAASEVKAKNKAAKGKAAGDGSAPAPGEAKAGPTVEVVPPGPRRDTVKVKCAEILDPIWAQINDAYDKLPASSRGVFATDNFKRASLLDSKAKAELAKARKAGEVEHAVTASATKEAR
jgi:hypothetical protein